MMKRRRIFVQFLAFLHKIPDCKKVRDFVCGETPLFLQIGKRLIGSSFKITKQMMKSGTRYVALNTIEYTAGFIPSGA